MAKVQLDRPDLALFADPAGTRVQVPHLVTAPRTRHRDQAQVRFEGDEAPTTFRGDGQVRTYDVTCRFGQDEHVLLRDLLDLLDLAYVAPDGRLQMRSNWYAAAGLDLYEVVAVGDVRETPLRGRAWDVTFSATTVQHSIEI